MTNDIRSWIQKLTNDIRDKSEVDSLQYELSYIVSEFTKSLKRQSLRKDPYRYSSHPPDPEAYFTEGLRIIIRALIVLQDEELFANSVSKCP